VERDQRDARIFGVLFLITFIPSIGALALGPGLVVVPFGNGLILGSLMYSAGLVPRRMAWLGLIGGPLLLIGTSACLRRVG